MTYQRFGPSRLRTAHAERGWSLADLARNADLQPPTLSAAGSPTACCERSARAIATALGVPLESLAVSYTAADRLKPQQFAVEALPTADDFERLEETCRELATLAIEFNKRTDGRHECDAVAWADAADLVHAMADIRERGAQFDLNGFGALLEYHADRAHHTVSTLTPDRRKLLVYAFEAFKIGAGPLTYPPGSARRP